MQKIKQGPATLLFPMPAVLVGAEVDGKPNFMTAAWCGIAASSPPALTVGIRAARHTYKGMLAHNTFSINVPSAEMARVTDYCGIYSGMRRDKSELFDCFYGDLKTAPMISECPVNLECRVVHTHELGSHILVVGQITESYVSDTCLTEGKPDCAKIDPLVYSTAPGIYQRLGETVGKAFSIGKDKKEA